MRSLTLKGKNARKKELIIKVLVEEPHNVRKMEILGEKHPSDRSASFHILSTHFPITKDHPAY
jgi:hypothetical protein